MNESDVILFLFRLSDSVGCYGSDRNVRRYVLFLFIDACSGIRDNYFGILFQGIGQCIVFSRTDGNIYVSFSGVNLKALDRIFRIILSKLPVSTHTFSSRSVL